MFRSRRCRLQREPERSRRNRVGLPPPRPCAPGTCARVTTAARAMCTLGGARPERTRPRCAMCAGSSGSIAPGTRVCYLCARDGNAERAQATWPETPRALRTNGVSGLSQSGSICRRNPEPTGDGQMRACASCLLVGPLFFRPAPDGPQHRLEGGGEVLPTHREVDADRLLAVAPSSERNARLPKSPRRVSTVASGLFARFDHLRLPPLCYFASAVVRGFFVPARVMAVSGIGSDGGAQVSRPPVGSSPARAPVKAVAGGGSPLTETARTERPS